MNLKQDRDRSLVTGQGLDTATTIITVIGYTVNKYCISFHSFTARTKQVQLLIIKHFLSSLTNKHNAPFTNYKSWAFYKNYQNWPGNGKHSLFHHTLTLFHDIIIQI